MTLISSEYTREFYLLQPYSYVSYSKNENLGREIMVILQDHLQYYLQLTDCS